MTDSTTNPSTLERVLTALAERGPVTAARISEVVGIAYPTTTPKLRELESVGYAERVRTEQRTTLWQVTETGKAAASVVPGSASMRAPAECDGRAGESQQRADLRPEAEPEPASEASVAGQVSDDPPTGNQAGESAETGQASPAPAAGPVAAGERATALQAKPEPMPELETNQTADVEHQTPAPAEGSGAGTQERDGRRKPAQPRRRKGELREAVLTLLQGNPGTAYKVGEICKLLNQEQARDGAQVNKASAGAVANALDKLVIAGSVTRVDTKVATYQAD